MCVSETLDVSIKVQERALKDRAGKADDFISLGQNEVVQQQILTADERGKFRT